MYVVYINLLYFCRFFCLLTIKIFFPKKNIQDGCCRQNKQHRTTTAIYQQSLAIPTEE